MDNYCCFDRGFIVGYRVLTSDTRKAIDTISNLLKIKPIYIESMLQEMGPRQTQMFIRSTSNGSAEEVRKAAYLVFIYHTFIKTLRMKMWSCGEIP